MFWKISVAIVLVIVLLLQVVSSCEEGDVRLTGSESNNTGRVEFCYKGNWGTVCDDSWDNDDARVVCRQLGFNSTVVSALIGFGGGSGEIFIDNSACDGSELRLEDCSHNGIRNHNCEQDDHSEDAGVICFPDEEDTSCDFGGSVHQPLNQNPSQCHEDNNIQTLPSQLCVHKYGVCVPFYPDSIPSICDDFYEHGVDYVFVPRSRSRGSFKRLIGDISQYGQFLLNSLIDCYEPARRVLCHYYLPPCGNSSHFESPTAVCPDTCLALSQQCPDEWAAVEERFGQNNALLSTEGLQLIDCAFPGKHLAPLPHCCTNLGSNTSRLTKDEGTQGHGVSMTPVYVGSSLAALVVLVLLGTALAITILYKQYNKQPKPMVISKPQSYHGSQLLKANRVDIVVEEAPPIPDHYDNVTTSTLNKREGSVTRIPRVLSGFIRQMSEDKLLIPQDSIDLLSIVGQGEFGVVYRGTLTNWKDYCHHIVAVKTLKGVVSSSDLRHLVEESQIMARFDHPHVMQLLGVSINSEQTMFLVMPFMSQGSLLSYLRKNRANLTVENEDMTDLIDETISTLLSMCLQIAKGMAYLASEKFLHRDLAARNCMMDLHNVIKVADFGLSEDVYSRNYFRQATTEVENEEDAPVKLPLKWMALESLNDGIFSEKTDVWSFGVTCWEVFSLGRNPYPGVDPFSLIRYLERGDRLDKPLNAACSQEIYNMMMDCWNKSPKDRPTFSELVMAISTNLEDLAGYLDFNTPSEATIINSDPEIIPHY